MAVSAQESGAGNRGWRMSSELVVGKSVGQLIPIADRDIE
jgi:hypothetical protein